MKCPYCGHLEDKVLDSRPAQDFQATRRRRECVGCHRRFTTFEQIEELKVQVVKHDGRREPFDSQKVLKGMAVACQKRSISTDQLKEVVDDIERRVANRGEREISSSEIGEMVMAALEQIDLVAYVRFVSVYRQFEDPAQFREVANMLSRKHRNRKN